MKPNSQKVRLAVIIMSLLKDVDSIVKGLQIWQSIAWLILNIHRTNKITFKCICEMIFANCIIFVYFSLRMVRVMRPAMRVVVSVI